MPTQLMYQLPPPSFEASDDAIIELLLLDEDQLLSVVKSHAATEVIPDLLQGQFPGGPFVAFSMGFSILGFLRERVARPAGKHLAVVIGICSSNGGRDICELLDYCNRRDQLASTVDRARDIIIGRLGLEEARSRYGQLLDILRERLGEQEFEELIAHLSELKELLGPLMESVSLFGDFAAPFVTPVSFALFVVLYTLDELCQCDKPADLRNWSII